MAFIYDLTDTWNASGTTFNAIKMNVTDSASAAASKLVTLQVGGSERFGVRKDGQGYFAGNVGIGTSAPSEKLTVAGPETGNLADFSNGVNANFLIKSTTQLLTAGPSVFSSLAFQTNNVERMRIDSSGNVGIGTSSPSTVGGGGKLVIAGNLAFDQNRTITFNGAGQSLITNPADAGVVTINAGTTSGFVSAINIYGGASGAPNVINFATASTERMRIDSSGNLLVGTATTAYGTAGRGLIEVNGSSSALIAIKTGDTARGYFAASSTATELSAVGASQPLLFTTNSAERMRIDSSGNLLVGTTTPIGTGWTVNPNGSGQIRSTGTGSEDKIQFANGNGVVGAITTNGTATAYNTSSDYRLKNIDGPIANSGAYIDALKPVQGSWKADGSRFIGLLAHEVQEVSETQIATGEKDGEEMQAMDYSAPEIIANLIAEVQSLRARVAQLEGN